jgi:CheY-like chemotaxis protein
MTYTVLYIEDEPLIIELVKNVLVHPDVLLVPALTGRGGLAKARELKPDIILLDIMMPDYDGWDIYEEIRADEELGSTPIIMITALAHKYRIQHEFERSPIDAYITKPFSARGVRAEIEKMLGVTLWPSSPRSGE